MDDWELPVSEIQSTLQIEHYGCDGVEGLINRALEGPLDNGVMQLLACQKDILQNYMVVSERVRMWRNDLVAIPSHSLPIHPFDAHRRVFIFFNDEQYTPGEAPNDTPTLEALAREYDRWFLLTLLGKFRYDDWKASRGEALSGAASTEDDDWGDFLRSKRGDRTQHHRAGRDEQTNNTYTNMLPVSPSGLTTTMRRQSYTPPQADQLAPGI